MATGTSKKAPAKRTTSTKKNTSQKKKTGTSKPRMTAAKRREMEQKRVAFRNEVILWCMLAVCVALFVSNFGIGGVVGNALSSFFFGIFGMMAYIFPICLFVGTAFAISNRENKIAAVKVIAAILFVAFLCLFVQLVSDSDHSMKIAETFQYSKETRAGGGIIGGLLENLLCPNFGVVSAFVIDIVVLIISLVLITERSAIAGVQKGSKKIYDSAKDDAARRKEYHIQRREEQAYIKNQRRIDRKASGVALDTRIVPLDERGNEGISDEVNEIRFPEDFDEPAVTKANHVQLKADAKPVADVNRTKVTPVDASCETPELEQDVIQDFHKLFEEPISIPTPVGIVAPEPTPNVTSKQTHAATPVVHPDIAEETAPEPAAIPEPAPKKRNPKQSVNEIEENISEIEDAISQVQEEPVKQYVFPPIDLLKKGDKNAAGDSQKHLQDTAVKLQTTLKNFGVNIKITGISCGPAVTRYEFQPEMGVKVSKIVNLADDIKLNLAAADIRMEAPIPGKAAIGIEIPNKESVPVMFRDLVETDDFKNHPSSIAFTAGKDISGKTIVTDIAKMPHLLIAGATGSGKSVCINTIIMSILYHAKPEDVKLIMIDPKVVELSVYNGIPHLFIPVVTDPKKASGALHWAVSEMTDRYNKFADYGVRDLKGYNKKVEDLSPEAKADPNAPKKMPQLVIIVDELADLMMVAPGDVEDAICRLAQLARAAGIHLIIATQRPSVNVITGLIKANMPSRIAFSVTSGVDSRTILDMNGAEKLLGKGDMLFYPQGFQKPLRVQGAFVSDKEVADVVEFLKEQNGEVSYSNEIQEKLESAASSSNSSDGSGDSGNGNDRDVYFVDAAKLLIDKDKGSIGMLQRYFKVGFNRAARIMDQLEEAGVVGPDEGTKPRQVLMSPEQLDEFIEEYV